MTQTDMEARSRFVKTRKQHFCCECASEIPSGEHARIACWYDKNHELVPNRAYYHPQCWHRYMRSRQRLKLFLDSGRCKHKVTYMAYSVMPGESHLMEPDGEKCFICGNYVRGW